MSKPMAKLDGVGYFAARSQEPLRDRFVVKVARDDDDRYFFYQATSVIGGRGEGDPSALYLKLGRDSYIKVSPTGKDPAAPTDEDE